MPRPSAVIVAALLILTTAVVDSDADTPLAPTWNELETGQATLGIQLGGTDFTALLRPAEVRAPGFRVRVQTADGLIQYVTTPPPSVWTGQLIERPDSRVIMRRQGTGLRGTIEFHGEDDMLWQIEGNDVRRIRRDGSLTGACAVVDHAPARWHTHPGATKDAAAPVLICELACDTDVEFYTANDSSVDDTVADIETIIAGVSQIYALDAGVAFQLTDILVRTAEPDPYTTTNPNALLEQFSTEWRDNQDHIPRDLAHLFTGKDLDGTPIGIAWQAHGVCNSYYGYSLVQSQFSEDLGERVAISAHEIGHTFDAVHCDYGGSWWCRIMCSAIGGCAGGYHSFGPLAIEDVVDLAGDVDCLDPGEFTVPTTTLPFSDDFGDSGQPDPSRWMAGDFATIISGRLELESGDTWGVNELGTIRTLPMNLTSGATLTFSWRSHGLPAGQPLRIEYFDSDTWSWVLLESLLATGDTSGPWSDVEIDVPATAAGPFFALRFSADGNGGDWNDEWHFDNMQLEAATIDVGDQLPRAGLLQAVVAPNPFNPRTEVVLNLARTAQVRVRVHDAAGRLVGALHDGLLAAGEHRLAWDARDRRGQALPTGIYMLQIDADGERTTLKAALLK